MAPSTAEQYVSLVESLLAGTVHLVRRTCSTNISHLTSRFRKFVGDETIFAALAGHFEVVRVLRRTGARALTARYPNYCHKYLSGYLAKSFGKKLRRKVLIFHHEFLAKKLSEKLYGRILLDGLVLWSETIEGNSYSISCHLIHGGMRRATFRLPSIKMDSLFTQHPSLLSLDILSGVPNRSCLLLAFRVRKITPKRSDSAPERATISRLPTFCSRPSNQSRPLSRSRQLSA
jgi:hypothetical protein